MKSHFNVFPVKPHGILKAKKTFPCTASRNAHLQSSCKEFLAVIEAPGLSGKTVLILRYKPTSHNWEEGRPVSPAHSTSIFFLLTTCISRPSRYVCVFFQLWNTKISVKLSGIQVSVLHVMWPQMSFSKQGSIENQPWTNPARSVQNWCRPIVLVPSVL